MTRLNGKTALITGSTDGVGRLREARADEQAYDAKARQRLKAISIELTSLSSTATVSAG